jgi:hypothetical protein
MFQPNRTLRIGAGIRFHKSGNKVILHDEYYKIIRDSVSFEATDSVLVSVNGHFKYDQYYLSAPVTANLFLKGLPVYVLGGVELGYLQLASSSYDLSFNELKIKGDSEEKGIYRPLDLCLNVGAGFKIDLNRSYCFEIQAVCSAGAFMINTPDDWFVDFKSREISLRGVLTTN